MCTTIRHLSRLPVRPRAQQNRRNEKECIHQKKSNVKIAQKPTTSADGSTFSSAQLWLWRRIVEDLKDSKATCQNSIECTCYCGEHTDWRQYKRAGKRERCWRTIEAGFGWFYWRPTFDGNWYKYYITFDSGYVRVACTFFFRLLVPTRRRSTVEPPRVMRTDLACGAFCVISNRAERKHLSTHRTASHLRLLRPV